MLRNVKNLKENLLSYETEIQMMMNIRENFFIKLKTNKKKNLFKVVRNHQEAEYIYIFLPFFFSFKICLKF